MADKQSPLINYDYFKQYHTKPRSTTPGLCNACKGRIPDIDTMLFEKRQSGELSPDEYRIIIARMSDYSISEIADDMGLCRQTVSKMIHTIKEKLSPWMDRAIPKKYRYSNDESKKAQRREIKRRYYTKHQQQKGKAVNPY